MLSKLSVEELCMKLRPIFGKKIDDLYLRYAVADSQEAKDEIVSLLSVLYQKNLNELLDKRVLLEPPREGAVDGDYPLGLVSYAGKRLFPFKLTERDWPRHMCVTGMSGSGKTTFAFSVIGSLMKKNKRFLIFDWKKSFRPLIMADSDLMCFTVGNELASNLFRVNINKPPKGVGPREWINVLCDLLTEGFGVSFGVHKVLLETLEESFRSWGVYDGSENYPTWEHIKWNLEQKLDKSRGRVAGWLESALRIATVLTFGNFGKVCNYKGDDAFDIENLFDRNVILELNTLGVVEKKFFCEFVLVYLYRLRKAGSVSDFNYSILVDEAHNVFLKDRVNFSAESVTDVVYREMREYGVSLVCLDQHISKLSDSVKGNSACHVAFQQQLPQDVYDVSGLMQLVDRKHFFSMLPVGSAIVKLSDRHTEPFLIDVIPSKLKDFVIDDRMIKERNLAIFSGKRVKKVSGDFFNELDSFDISYDSDGALMDNLDKLKPIDYESVKCESYDFSGLNLSREEEMFLSFLLNNNGKEYGVVEVYRFLGLSPRKGNEIKNKFIDGGFISVEDMKTDRGRRKVMRLNDVFFNKYKNFSV